MGMGNLQFEGSHEQQWGQMKSAVIQLDAVINGNGRQGLRADVAQILSIGKAILWLLGFIVALLGLACTAVVAHHDLTQDNHAHTTSSTQDAGAHYTER